jgi:hypothetical protein
VVSLILMKVLVGLKRISDTSGTMSSQVKDHLLTIPYLTLVLTRISKTLKQLLLLRKLLLDMHGYRYKMTMVTGLFQKPLLQVLTLILILELPTL